MKRSILVVIAVILLVIISVCNFEKEEKITDALKFKNEYESINGDKIGETDYKVRKLNIPEDNPFVYAEANDIISMMDNNDTFVVYFGFSSCPWCRSVLPTLLEVAEVSARGRSHLL
jgi:thiol-disulfide isomerase/thioredoxin